MVSWAITASETMGAFDSIDLFNIPNSGPRLLSVSGQFLQLNSGNGLFRDIARYAGVPATDWDWGLMFDMDNDGWMDLIRLQRRQPGCHQPGFHEFFADEVYHSHGADRPEGRSIELLQKNSPHTFPDGRPSGTPADLAFSDRARPGGRISRPFPKRGGLWEPSTATAIPGPGGPQ